MKKIISVLCIFVLVLTCFAACGKGNTPTDASAEKWSKLCESDADEEIAAMYAYLNYVCNWESTTRTEDGKMVFSDPYSTLLNIVNEDSDFYYAYKEGYFDGIIEQIKALGDDYGIFISNIERAKALSEKALNALINKEYTFSKETGRYTLNNDAEIKNEYNSLRSEYNSWLESQS